MWLGAAHAVAHSKKMAPVGYAYDSAAGLGPDPTAVEVTRLVKSGGPLTKKLHLAADGELVNDSSLCRMAKGRMERIRLDDWRALAPLIEATPRNVAWALGAMRDGLPDAARLVLKDSARAGKADCVARTSANLVYRPKRPALVLIDYDTKGMPADVRARIDELGGFAAALAAVCPAIAGAGYIERRSTSAGISNAATGETYPSEGRHLYLLAEDGADAKRFLYALHERAWLCGLGWYVVGRAGRLLERSIVDRMVCAPERLIFEAAPNLEPPLEQRPRPATVHNGSALDTLTACPALTNAEEHEAAHRKAQSAQSLKGECAAAERRFIEERADEAVARGIDPTRARATAEAWGRSVLRPSAMLAFNDKKIGTKCVGDVLTDPERYLGKTLADPIEGIEYGRQTAKILRRHGRGELFINSFAHGGRTFTLRHDFDSLTAIVEGLDAKEAAQKFCDLMLIAEVDPVEEKLLIDQVGKLSGAGILPVKTMLKKARAGKRQGNPNQDVVMVDGVEKRVTTLESLNERFALLEAFGRPSVFISRRDLLPIQDLDLGRRLASEVVMADGDYQAAYNFWTSHAQRHVYRSIVFSSRKDLPSDAYNLYRGLGVTPREGCCELILAHIRDVICSGNLRDTTAMLDLMAWQMQNIGQPSRIVVLLKSEEQQAGKGAILGEVLLPIYGPSGFAPGDIEKVIGRFNDAVRGVSYIFLDEVLFAGDKRAADRIKRLSTATSDSIEGKKRSRHHVPDRRQPLAGDQPRERCLHRRERRAILGAGRQRAPRRRHRLLRRAHARDQERRRWNRWT